MFCWRLRLQIPDTLLLATVGQKQGRFCFRKHGVVVEKGIPRVKHFEVKEGFRLLISSSRPSDHGVGWDISR